ncbi:MAG: hypothetical protein ACI33P_00980 [Lysinibacillus sp.]
MKPNGNDLINAKSHLKEIGQAPEKAINRMNDLVESLYPEHNITAERQEGPSLPSS